MKLFNLSNVTSHIPPGKHRTIIALMCVGIALFSPFRADSYDFLDKNPKKEKQPLKSVSNYLESGYNQVGDTRLYLRQSYNFDFWGQFGEFFYGSTFANGGYQTALKVNDNYPQTIDAANPTEVYGIEFNTLFEAQGEMVKVSYVLKNISSENVNISLGTYADVQIGDNDCAPISRRINNDGSTYGLTMKDGSGAELCILFGAGIAGVSPVSDFWFGNYGGNSDPYNIVGEYHDSGNFMLENGSYDSAMGWCWKDRVIQPGDSATYSFLIGIGDVNLKPGLSYAATPDDPESWNDINLLHKINIEGIYSSPAGVDGRIEYAVEYPEMWQSLTETMPSGTEFSSFIEAYFDPSLKIHSIYLRIIDNVGNTTMLDPIQYIDVNHVDFDPFTDFTYDGQEHFQNVSTWEIESDKFMVSNYQNNINAGTAYFSIEGVYPETIGRKFCEFQIIPAPIEGKILLTNTEYDFTGYDIWPEYSLEGQVASLVDGNGAGSGGDYVIYAQDNHYAGNNARLIIEGRNNYQGTITSEPFTINKINWPEDWIRYWLPEADTTFDGNTHQADADDIDGMGEKIITYVSQNNISSTEAPSEAGTYDVYLEYTEGPGIYAIPQRNIGQFSIYNLDEDDWKSLVALREELQKDNDKDNLWVWEYLNEGITGVTRLKEYGLLDIEKGKIKKLWLGARYLKGVLPLSAFYFKNLEEIRLNYNELTGSIDILASLSETNPDALKSIKLIELNDNQLTGNAGVFALFQNLEYLDIGNNKISEVYPMLKPELDLWYYNQTLDKTITLDLRNLDIESLAAQIPTIAFYNHSEQKYDTDHFSVWLHDKNDWHLRIKNDSGEISTISYGSFLRSYKGKSGDAVDIEFGIGDYGICNLSGELFFSQGDVNFSATVDVLDVQTIILEILEDRFVDNHQCDQIPFNFTAANLFEDEAINVQDAVCLVNMLLENDPLARHSPRRLSVSNTNNAEASVFALNGALYLSSETEIAAFDVIIDASDIEIADIPGMSLAKKTTNGKTRLIGYSPAGITLPAGTVKIGDTSAESVSYAQLSDIAAKEVKVSLNNTASGISSVSSGNANASITADGIEVSLPDGAAAQWVITTTSGIIIAQGSSASEHGTLFIPFNAEKNVVYLLSVKHDGGTINKKLIRNN